MRLAFLILVVLLASPSLVANQGTTYFLDCDSGQDSSPGTSVTSAWASLEKVNQTTFQPGDSILIKRGTRCSGALWPKGSGKPGSPIQLGAYGRGPLPVVLNPSGSEPTLKLFNQEHWHLSQLELVGGAPYGLYIGGDRGVLRHFRLTDLVVHGVTGKPENKRTGLVAILAGSPEQTFEDVTLDGVTAYDTTQWAGIVLDGGHPPLPRGADGKTPPTLKAKGVTVRNCLVHDVAGDGIVLFRVIDGLLEGNVAWATGMLHDQDPQGPKNPNSIWVWRCENCTVQYNEGFFSESEGVDGGVYDIDWGSHGNVIQYNYGHDSQGYCLSVFGAGGGITTNSVVRYNVCANNGRSPRLARRQGDLYISTWAGGSLDGVQVYNNTFYWNPPVDAPLLVNDAQFVGNRPNFFKNNLVISTVPTFFTSNSSLTIDSNGYWYPGIGSPRWVYRGRTFEGFDEYRKGSGQDQKGLFADPLLSVTSRGAARTPFRLAAGSPALGAAEVIDSRPLPDFFGVRHNSHDIGAVQSSADDSRPASFGRIMLPAQLAKLFDDAGPGARWLLAAVFPTEFREGDQADLSRSCAVSMRSALQQYRRAGLEAVILVPGSAGSQTSHADLAYDWSLAPVQIREYSDGSVATLLGVSQFPAVVLIGRTGEVLGRWEGRTNPARLGLTLRWLLGPPA